MAHVVEPKGTALPESRHRRKGRMRPRPSHVEPPRRNPEPSPRWLPVTGAGLLVAGIVVILLGYLPVVARYTSGLPALGANWPLVTGFVLLAVGFGLLTRWH